MDGLDECSRVPARMPPAAILDVDGTLVDTNYQHAIAWYRAFHRNGVVLPIWRIHRHIGMGGDHLVALRGRRRGRARRRATTSATPRRSSTPS